MLYGDKEMKQFTNELNAFYKAKSELKTKLINYLDNLDEEIEILVTLGEEEICFTKISNELLETEDGFDADYRFFAVEELIEVVEEIIKYHQNKKEEK